MCCNVVVQGLMLRVCACRYQEIAERAYRVGQQRAVQSGQQARALKLAGRPMPFPQMLAQELFRMTLFCIFFLQSLAAGCIPVIGQSLPSPPPPSPHTVR